MDCCQCAKPITDCTALCHSCCELLNDEIDDLRNNSTTVVTRFVLYDFDADELASGIIYNDVSEAADDADLLDNVIVVPFTPIHTTPQSLADEEND